MNSEENDCYVPISARQRAWLTAELEKAARQKALAFLFLHQPLRDTVSGSLCSVDPLVQSWHGVIEDAELRAVTDRFPGLVLFTGHTHWKFDSLQPFLPGNGKARKLYQRGVRCISMDGSERNRGKRRKRSGAGQRGVNRGSLPAFYPAARL